MLRIVKKIIIMSRMVKIGEQIQLQQSYRSLSLNSRQEQEPTPDIKITFYPFFLGFALLTFRFLPRISAPLRFSIAFSPLDSFSISTKP